jgi:fused signal recognition particle receptor
MFDFLKKIFKDKTTADIKKDSKEISSEKAKKNSSAILKKTDKRDVDKKKISNTPKLNKKIKNIEKENDSKKINNETIVEKTSSFSEKIKFGLKKTRESLNKNLTSLVSFEKIDQKFYDELEELLLNADVGYSATTLIIDELRKKVKQDKPLEGKELKGMLRIILTELLERIEKPLIKIEKSPFVILIVGVNGAGKTTTIGKLTKLLLDEDKSVLIAAGDTFRAAAKEQLQVWGERNNVTVISQETGDPSAVIYDAMQSAKAKNVDIVIADTAGRLPSQKHLIDELAKIKKVIKKFDSSAPHETILVLDANTGQNAINQIKTFNEAVPLTGLIMTKLDGTAKGGILAAVARENPIPLRFIGVGEKIDDLKIFSASEYAEGMLE